MIAIIAGTGGLPRALLQACQQRQQPYFLLAYQGFTDPTLIQDDTPHIWLSLGQIDKALSALRTRSITDIVMAGGGAIARPSLKNLKLDKGGMRLLAKIGLRWPGDNHVLKTVAMFLEQEGFCLRSPQDFLPSFLAPAGPLGRHHPSATALEECCKGREVLAHLSRWDFGQGIALQNGLILAIEAAEGTDACIARSGLLQRPGEGRAIYVKRAKIGQDERLDLPVIGPKTLDTLIQMRFQGIAFQAGKTLILMPESVQQKADEAGLFLWGEE